MLNHENIPDVYWQYIFTSQSASRSLQERLQSIFSNQVTFILFFISSYIYIVCIQHSGYSPTLNISIYLICAVFLLFFFKKTLNIYNAKLYYDCPFIQWSIISYSGWQGFYFTGGHCLQLCTTLDMLYIIYKTQNRVVAILHIKSIFSMKYRLIEIEEMKTS